MSAFPGRHGRHVYDQRGPSPVTFEFIDGPSVLVEMLHGCAGTVGIMFNGADRDPRHGQPARRRASVTAINSNSTGPSGDNVTAAAAARATVSRLPPAG